MSRLRLVVHLGLDRNNEVQCYAVQMCGRLIPFGGSFEFKERYLKTSYWCSGDVDWVGFRGVREWKKFTKKGYRVVRFQRVTYIRDVD